ncbi:hypothetical protein [Galenea microaerophila]
MARRAERQNGYILMVTLILLVVGAAVWFSSGSVNLNARRAHAVMQDRLGQMEKIKKTLLIYATMTPTIMQAKNKKSPPPLNPVEKVPGPGYLPCWDTVGDGEIHCSFTAGDYHPHYLPQHISNRHFYFGERAKQYYFVLDQRFAIQNSSYNNSTTKRYAPLNPAITPAPSLHLNQDGKNYVALIIYAPDGLDADNNDGDTDFFSKTDANPGINDLIVGITASEWANIVQRHVENLKPDLCNTDASEKFWFNDYDAANNPTGSSWRSYLGGC